MAVTFVGPNSYTVRLGYSLSARWRGYWKAIARTPKLWRALLLLGAGLTSLLTMTGLIAFHWMTVILTFSGAVAAIALIYFFVALLQAGSMPYVVQLGPDGCCINAGQVSVEFGWGDVNSVQEREGYIAIECTTVGGFWDRLTGGVRVPDRAFRDETARLKFLDDVRRWYALAHAANTEHA